MVWLSSTFSVTINVLISVFVIDCMYSVANITMSVIDFTLGPKPDVSYPIKVLYCGNCSMPIEVS